MTTTITRRAALRDLGAAATSLPAASLAFSAGVLPAAPDARLAAIVDGIFELTQRGYDAPTEAEAEHWWSESDKLDLELIATPAEGLVGIWAKWRIFAYWRQDSEGGIIDDLADSIDADLKRLAGGGV